MLAASGRRVTLFDDAPGATERALERMTAEPREAGGEGRARSAEEVLARVEVVEDLVPADLMIEAVIEAADVKEELFRRADGLLPPDAVLASNTSSIPIGSSPRRRRGRTG